VVQLSLIQSVIDYAYKYQQIPAPFKARDTAPAL